jgi:hypothetical protein
MNDGAGDLVELDLHSLVPFQQMLGHTVGNGAIKIQCVKLLTKKLRQKGVLTGV